MLVWARFPLTFVTIDHGGTGLPCRPCGADRFTDSIEKLPGIDWTAAFGLRLASVSLMLALSRMTAAVQPPHLWDDVSFYCRVRALLMPSSGIA
jgi:hypothetical protein